jgi:membrane protein
VSATGEEGRVARLRVVAERVVETLGGVPAVRVLLATFSAYDAGGGGLVAGGLAYSALIALLPGLLLALSIFGLVVTDPAIREQLVTAIGDAVPPIEDLARTALNQVSTGAVPSSLVAIVGLLWAASRFYVALDNAISRIFGTVPRRNPVQQTIRGLLLTALLVALPIAAVFAGSILSWLVSLIPGRSESDAASGVVAQLAWPIGTFVLFVVATVMVYRFVPAVRVPAGAWRVPAILVGLALAVFTQVFALFAPLMFRTAALYGAIVTVFALLAWMAIGFNLLLFGAAWTWVRAQPLLDTVTAAGDEPRGDAPG